MTGIFLAALYLLIGMMDMQQRRMVIACDGSFIGCVMVVVWSLTCAALWPVRIGLAVWRVLR